MGDGEAEGEDVVGVVEDAVVSGAPVPCVVPLAGPLVDGPAPASSEREQAPATRASASARTS